MLFLLIALFIAVPLVELALLVWMGGQVGVGTTIALVIVTGILGASLARWQGLATLSRFQRRLAAGELPHEDVVEGILILVAGAVLLTPGLLTDTAGFLLLVPPVRSAIGRRLITRLRRRFEVAATRMGETVYRAEVRRPRSVPGADGDVVDAEFEVKE